MKIDRMQMSLRVRRETENFIGVALDLLRLGPLLSRNIADGCKN